MEIVHRTDRAAQGSNYMRKFLQEGNCGWASNTRTWRQTLWRQAAVLHAPVHRKNTKGMLHPNHAVSRNPGDVEPLGAADDQRTRERAFCSGSEHIREQT